LGFCSLSLSAALVARRPPATKFSRPAAQHPFWTGLRHRRQKAEQADRGLGLRLGSGLGLCSLSLSARRPPNFLGLRRSTHFGLPPAAQKAESRASRSGTTPSFKGGGDLVLGLSSGVALLSRSPSRLLVGSSATKFSRPAAQHPAPIFGWPAAQKRQKAERADRRPPAHLLQGGRDLVLSLVGLSLSACRPPNFLGLRRSTHFGLPPAAQKAESRASRSGSTPSPPPSFKGGGVI
jgi:hypothetical protein